METITINPHSYIRALRDVIKAIKKEDFPTALEQLEEIIMALKEGRPCVKQDPPERISFDSEEEQK